MKIASRHENSGLTESRSFGHVDEHQIAAGPRARCAIVCSCASSRSAVNASLFRRGAAEGAAAERQQRARVAELADHVLLDLRRASACARRRGTVRRSNAPGICRMLFGG